MLTTLLYGAEFWATYHRHLCLIEHYHQRCLCTSLNINWSDFVTNIEVLEMAKVTSIKAMFLKTLLYWAGHVSKMEDHHLTKIVLYRLESCPLAIVTKEHLRQDSGTLKKSFASCNINHCQWTIQATNHMNWRSLRCHQFI